MAKISFTKLGLKKNTNLITLNWNDQIIEIKAYLPIEEKIAVIERIVNQSLDENNFANPMRVDVNILLEIIFAYTNINFTDKQKEDRLALYDLLVGNEFWVQFLAALPNEEYMSIYNGVWDTINEIYKYRDSVLGIIEAVNQDYSNLNLDAENIQKNLADPNNLTLLKDVVTKLG